ADQSEVFRTRLDEIFQGWSDRYASCLQAAQEAGEIPADLDVRELAEFWLNGWQGGGLRAKTARSTAPLRPFLNLMFGYVLRRSEGGRADRPVQPGPGGPENEGSRQEAGAQWCL